MKKIFAFSLLIGLFTFSCKDKNDPTPPAAAKVYQPTTVGSTWNYETTNKLTSAKTTYTLTATATKTTFAGREYQNFTRSGGGSTEYYTKSNSDYYQYGGIAGVTDPTELLYLKSDAAAGATWQETNKSVTIPGVGTATLDLSYQVVEKLDSYVLGSNTYKNVYHIKVSLSNIKISGISLSPTHDLHFYYADGVGRIKTQIKFQLAYPPLLNINVDDETTLQSSNILP